VDGRDPGSTLSAAGSVFRCPRPGPVHLVLAASYAVPTRNRSFSRSRQETAPEARAAGERVHLSVAPGRDRPAHPCAGT
jgi:hypothetical protein